MRSIFTVALSLGLLWVISPLVLLGGGLGQVFGLLFVVLLGLQVSAHLAHWREKSYKNLLTKIDTSKYLRHTGEILQGW